MKNGERIRTVEADFPINEEDRLKTDKIPRSLAGEAGYYLNKLHEKVLELQFHPVLTTETSVRELYDIAVKAHGVKKAQQQLERLQRIFESTPSKTMDQAVIVEATLAKITEEEQLKTEIFED